MRTAAWTTCLISAAIISGCSAGRLSTLQIYGSWKVAEVLCSGCGGPVLSLKGRLIEIGKQHAINPAGDDCEGTVSTQFVREVDVRHILAVPGTRWPASVRDAAGAKPKILYGFLTCNGVNYMQIALISPDSAYYFLEGGVTLALSRAR